MPEIGSPGWLNERKDKDIPHELERPLRRSLKLPDGIIRMTKGLSPELTMQFTDRLTLLDAFNRTKDILTDHERDAILLHYEKGLTKGEIGTVLGISKGSVRINVDKGLRKITEAMVEIVCDPS